MLCVQGPFPDNETQRDHCNSRAAACQILQKCKGINIPIFAEVTEVQSGWPEIELDNSWPSLPQVGERVGSFYRGDADQHLLAGVPVRANIARHHSRQRESLL
mmetsp:Transcript_29586/g.90774  ORF Transcript_29586/g.90774 Transcript_29586/m.90774 type:complete len:103 (+) Transcript_29586:1121-1429(+)